MSQMIDITIDGKPCTCKSGALLYDVARENGIFIPTLCRSDAFDDHRACCRICIVEVITRGRSKVVASCVYPIEGPCEVLTNSPKIKEERAVLAALLTRRAPESEHITELAHDLGGDEGFDRLIGVDGEKCILCGLCVQACAALGTGAISTVDRGTTKRIDTPYSSPSKDCIGCLSCANICPTDAIPFEDDGTTRTIWHRTFDLVHCSSCGAVMGTEEAVRHAGGLADGEEPLCDACRRRQIADSMMETYRYV